LPVAAASASTFPDDIELPFELGAIDSESAHVRANEILAQIAIHLDDHRSGQTGPGHDQMITLYS
jgi:hypothetical protein